MAQENAYALASVDKVKRFLGHEFASQREDWLLVDLINGVSSWCESYCGRKFKSRTYTHNGTTLPRLDGDGTSIIWLDNPPVSSVTTLKIHPDADALTEGWDGEFVTEPHKGMIKLIGGLITIPFLQTVEVTYIGGWLTNPGSQVEKDHYGWEQHGADIEMSVIKQVAEMYHRRTRQRDGVASTSVEGVSTTYVDAAILKDVKVTWDRHRMVRV